MMWAGCDNDHVIINTEIHRHKFRHLVVGAKATVLVFETPFKWAEVRGTVVEHVGGDAARVISMSCRCATPASRMAWRFRASG